MFRVPQYKFFGPHLGALYGRYELLDRLQAYKVRPAEDVPPDKFGTGTKNHEGLAGTTAAINYLADLGSEFGAPFADQYPSDPDGIVTSLRLFRVYFQHHPKIITYMPPRVLSSGSYPRLYVRTVPELNI